MFIPLTAVYGWNPDPAAPYLEDLGSASTAASSTHGQDIVESDFFSIP